MKIIFHIPWKIDSSYASGSAIRPIKIIEAFKKIGCEMDVVMGTGKERYNQIKIIKEKIKNGEKYDFLYSESSTYPTIFTNSRYEALRFPFLDFSFFSFCKKNKIPIGLYYRDIHWKFPDIINTNNWFKKRILNYFYHYDLKKYRKYVDVLYVPHINMMKYISNKFPIVKSLPPGCNIFESRKSKTNSKINILYVGGLGRLYKIHKLIKIVGNFSEINLTICCRKEDLEKNEDQYKDLIKSNINFVHYKGDELEKLYEKIDIGSIFIEKHKYWEFALPLKLFEYMGNFTPIISTDGTAVGSFIKDNNIGWTIPYKEENLRKLFKQLKGNPEEIKEKQKNIEKIIKNHTWEARALQVYKDLF